MIKLFLAFLIEVFWVAAIIILAVTDHNYLAVGAFFVAFWFDFFGVRMANMHAKIIKNPSTTSFYGLQK